MARKAYNGWTKEQRTKSGREARKKYASGEWTRPVKCVVCWITVEQGALVHDHLEGLEFAIDAIWLCTQGFFIQILLRVIAMR